MTTGSVTICFVFVLFSVFVPGISRAYDYDPNDFAVEVVYYDPGTGVGLDYLTGIPFDDPTNALDEPTVDTTGANWMIPVSETVPVVSVYPAFRSFELVTVGNGGQLILKFSHPVADDQNNPYGIDFIIFGNAAQSDVDEVWTNDDPADCTITGSNLIADPGVVSVSQDGVSWYTFDPNTSPSADTFAPTLGRVYDPNNIDESIGAWNLWWGEPTNPTLPLDPNITPSDMAGLSVAEAAMLYGDSAGGTGFDISELGLDWIEYIRVAGNDYRPEVDAVSDVAACGDYKHPLPEGDLNLDCRVDIVDVRLLGENWLRSCDGGETPEDIGDISGDCKVNLADLAMINNSWLECSWDCQ